MSCFYSTSFRFQVSCGQTVLSSCLPETAKGKEQSISALKFNDFWMDMIWFSCFQGQTINDIPPEVLIDCAQLVKNNSIQGKDPSVNVFTENRDRCQNARWCTFQGLIRHVVNKWRRPCLNFCFVASFIFSQAVKWTISVLFTHHGPTWRKLEIWT